MTALEAEARYFHERLFRQPPDELTISRYAAAHVELFPGAANPAWIDRIIERRLDPEAVEFALRRRGCGRELTRKLHILCYLAEVRAAYLPQFVNFRRSRSRAWFSLIAAALGAAWKLLKGEISVRRHGLL